MRVTLRRAFYALCGLLLLGACDNVGKLAPLEPSPEELEGVEVCDSGRTFGEVARLDEISDDCRAEIELLLGEPSSTFTERLIVLAEQREEDARTFYVQATGDLPWSALRVEITSAGRVTELPREDLELRPLDGEKIALAVALDRSRTLRDTDLEASAELVRQLFEALPAGFEGSVTLFASETEVVQPPTSDRELLERALAPSDELPRERTALYDGMSTALATLEASERPVRLLFVVSDGRDNLPSQTRRGELRTRIADAQIAGVGAAALFADAIELRSLFGARGAIIQAPALPSLPEQFQPYFASLGELVEVRVQVPANAERVRIAIGDVGVVAGE